MVEIGPRRFGQMVDAALAGLPRELAAMMSNVAVVVHDTSADPHLLGVYEGVPLTERTSHYSAALPDRIVIYRLPICARCTSEDEVVEEVQVTVVHEIGHHFGIPDERLHELGW
jgi:predicted Zn-dependent protease with MMP-like domain